jgi:hypothetical protein
VRIQLHRPIHDRTSIHRPFAGPWSSASPSSPARAMVGAKGRRRGTVLADLAAEGDRNRVVIPLLRRAAGEAESVMGLPHSSRSRVCAVGMSLKTLERSCAPGAFVRRHERKRYLMAASGWVFQRTKRPLRAMSLIHQICLRLFQNSTSIKRRTPFSRSLSFREQWPVQVSGTNVSWPIFVPQLLRKAIVIEV